MQSQWSLVRTYAKSPNSGDRVKFFCVCRGPPVVLAKLNCGVMNKLRCAKAQADLLLPNNLFQLNNLNIPFTNLNYFLLFKVYYVYWSRPKQMWLVLSWKSLWSWFRLETSAFSAVWHSQTPCWSPLVFEISIRTEKTFQLVYNWILIPVWNKCWNGYWVRL